MLGVAVVKTVMTRGNGGDADRGRRASIAKCGAHVQACGKDAIRCTALFEVVVRVVVVAMWRAVVWLW